MILHTYRLLVRTIAHDLHASVVVASYTLHLLYTFTKSSDILNKQVDDRNDILQGIFTTTINFVTWPPFCTIWHY